MNNKFIIALTLMLGVVFAGHVSAQMGTMEMEKAKTEAVKTTNQTAVPEETKAADLTKKDVTKEDAAKDATKDVTKEDATKDASKDATKDAGKDVKKEGAAVQTCGQSNGSTASEEGEDD